MPTKTRQSPHEIEADLQAAFDVGDREALDAAISRIHDLAQERDELDATVAAVREEVAQ